MHTLYIGDIPVFFPNTLYVGLKMSLKTNLQKAFEKSSPDFQTPLGMRILEDHVGCSKGTKHVFFSENGQLEG